MRRLGLTLLLACACTPPPELECEVNPDCDVGEVCRDGGCVSLGEGEGDEGEGEASCDVSAFPPGSGLTTTKVTYDDAGIIDGLCDTPGGRHVYLVDVVVDGGRFDERTGNGNGVCDESEEVCVVRSADVSVASPELADGALQFCSTAPDGVVLADGSVAVTCVVCIPDEATLTEIAIQVRDGDGARSDARCALPD